VLAGLFIILGLAVLAAAVTYWLVTPVHEAARTARRFSSGHLDARMRVRGEDDLAQLAVSFNEMAGTLQAHIRDMEQMSKVQQRFVADVSHELRTPLTTVRMAADLLHDKRQELPTDDARAVELLQNQLNRFEALLADLLETSRQDSGSVHLTYEEIDLRGLVDRVVTSLQPLAREMGCEVEVLGMASLVVECDVLRVERILANLLSNALEHGEGKPVVVEVSQEGDRALLAVTDQGIGLSQEELSSVFTRFWRADPSRVRKIGGTGLGLSIALGDARAHGGTLTASGAPGQGATFTLLLPVVAHAPRTSPATGRWQS
jgi:two-component system sensor histidine kinase MtrB